VLFSDRVSGRNPRAATISRISSGSGSSKHEIMLVDVLNKCLVTRQLGDDQAETPLRYAALSDIWGTQKQFLTPHATPRGAPPARCPEPAASTDRGVGQHSRRRRLEAAISLGQQVMHRAGRRRQQTRADRTDDCHLRLGVAHHCGTFWHLIQHTPTGVSTRRPQLIEKVDVDPMTIQLSDLPTLMTGRTYETRAWTYQERLVSRRCVYFSENQAYFECARGSVGEQVKYLPNTIDRIDVNELRDFVASSSSRPDWNSDDTLNING